MAENDASPSQSLALGTIFNLLVAVESSDALKF
jgi:hypothetical protein